MSKTNRNGKKMALFEKNWYSPPKTDISRTGGGFKGSTAQVIRSVLARACLKVIYVEKAQATLLKIVLKSLLSRLALEDHGLGDLYSILLIQKCVCNACGSVFLC